MTTRSTTVRIAAVEALQGFTLRLRFTDGSSRDVDLEGELWGPVFEPLRSDPDLFRQVRVDEELGTIVWPGGADMDPDVLRGLERSADESNAGPASDLAGGGVASP